jgi:hypothetical protein
MRSTTLSKPIVILILLHVSVMGLHADMSKKHVRFRAVSPGAADAKEMVLLGHLYEPPKILLPILRAQSNNGAILQLVASDFSAQRNGDHAWILENWADEDKPQIEQMLADKDMAGRNQKMLRSISQLKAYGEVDYKGYRLLLIEYSGAITSRQVLSFKKANSGWKRTNALSADEGMQILGYAFENKTSVTGPIGGGAGSVTVE